MIDLLIVIISLLLSLLIILQPRGGGFSSIFGSWGGTVYYKRRGLEKYIFYLTIIVSALFLALSLIRNFI